MKKKSLGEVISEDIKKEILSGKYKAGDKLPTERELAEYYKVSRVPVREAISILTREDIVSVKRSSGIFVTNIPPSFIASEQDTPYLKNEVILQESVQLRRLIESEGSRQAAIHANAEDIIQIQESLFRSIDEIRKLKAGQDNHFFQADTEFHLAVANASHSAFFAGCLSSMPQIISNHQYWSLKNTTPMDEVVSYHTAIFEAILTQNPERAYEAMYQHLSRVKKLLTGNMPDNTGS